MTPQETIRALAVHVKNSVFPHLGTWRARKITGTASSGDATFDIDEIAEAAVESFLRENDINVAYYSEDRGLVHAFPERQPEGILIIDPIDGTRGAIAGFEACVVSIAWTDFTPAPTLGDVRYAAILEIKGGMSFTAERGNGIEILDVSGNRVRPFLSPTTETERMAWTLEVVGAPMDLLLKTLREVANPTTVRGGFFVLNSSAFSLTRLVTGQLAAVVDIRNRLLRDFPQTRDQFLTYGGGRVLSLYGYDIAAGVLIAREAGCHITDAWGRNISTLKLLDTTEPNFGSLIATTNDTLHARLTEAIHTGFADLQL